MSGEERRDVSSAEWDIRARRVLSPATRLPFSPVTASRGKGTWFWDHDDRPYLDLHAMAAIMNLGYSHPAVVAAVQAQAERLLHSNPAYVLHDSSVLLAEALVELTPGDFPKRVAFGLSGSDAIDGAIKLARAATGREKIVTFYGAYHGNTYGALSASAISLAMRRGFGPTLPGILHAPYPGVHRAAPFTSPEDVSAACIAFIEEMMATVADPSEIAAFLLEPIQGDSGIVIPPPSFLTKLAAICRERNILLIVDEIQTGFGRTGRWFGADHAGVVPDIVVLGKALGGGMPVSAIVSRAELMDHWTAPGHVFSTSANPVSLAAALTVVKVLAEESLAEAAQKRGDQLMLGLQALQDDYEIVRDVRGVGLMVGVDLADTHPHQKSDHLLVSKVVKGCLARGCYVTSLAGSVLRIVPPLVITASEVDRALEIIDAALHDVAAGLISDEEVRDSQGW